MGFYELPDIAQTLVRLGVPFVLGGTEFTAQRGVGVRPRYGLEPSRVFGAEARYGTGRLLDILVANLLLSAFAGACDPPRPDARLVLSLNRSICGADQRYRFALARAQRFLVTVSNRGCGIGPL